MSARLPLRLSQELTAKCSSGAVSTTDVSNSGLRLSTFCQEVDKWKVATALWFSSHHSSPDTTIEILVTADDENITEIQSWHTHLDSPRPASGYSSIDSRSLNRLLDILDEMQPAKTADNGTASDEDVCIIKDDISTYVRREVMIYQKGRVGRFYLCFGTKTREWFIQRNMEALCDFLQEAALTAAG